MAQVTTGIRSILSLPSAYDVLMDVLGAKRMRREIIEQYVRPRPHERILDVGCGTGTLVEFIPKGIAYLGVDLSREYIEAAIRRYGDRASFRVGDAGRLSLDPEERFDIVLAFGLLHHLDDDEAGCLARTIRDLLKPDGRFVTVDNCFTQDQSSIARAIIRRDRGRNVRTPSEYETILRKAFGRVSSEIRHDLLRIPYTHVIIQAGGIIG